MQNYQKILIIGGAGLIVIAVIWAVLIYYPEFFQSLISLEILSTVSKQNFNPFAIFLILAFSTFVSEDIACLTAGTLAAQGRINLALAISACFAGIFLSNVLLFIIGRLGGTAILQLKIVKRFISEKTLERAKQFLDKYGIWAIFLSRFTPGLRLPLFILAGILQMNFFKFTLFFFLATAFWIPILVGGSAWIGQEFFEISFFENHFWLGLIIFVAALFLIIKIGLKLTIRQNC